MTMLQNNSGPGFFARVGRALGSMLNMSGESRNPNVVYEGYISGYQYHKGLQMEHLFGPDTTFSLKHEPENPFDDDAVALYYGSSRIGFIPPDDNVEIARRIQRGKSLKARIARFEPKSDPWERVYVEVVQEDENQMSRLAD
jgi:hypothetical protein